MCVRLHLFSVCMCMWSACVSVVLCQVQCISRVSVLLTWTQSMQQQKVYVYKLNIILVQVRLVSNSVRSV